MSRTDLLTHQGRRAVHLLGESGGADGRADPFGPTPVEAVMTPAVFCVRADTPAARVVEKMLALNVRRLFVVDEAVSSSGSSAPSTCCGGSAGRSGPPGRRPVAGSE